MDIVICFVPFDRPYFFIYILVLDSPTDISIYSNDRGGLSCDDYISTFANKNIKAPPTLPLSVEQVKLDSLTETSVVKQQEFEGKSI